MLTRRSFLLGTAAVLLPLSGAVSSMASTISGGGLRNSARRLCLEELGSDAYLDAPIARGEDGIEHRAFDLAGSRLMELNGAELRRAGYTAIAAIGSASAMFAIKTLLGSDWRIVLSGSHGIGGDSVHRVQVAEPLRRDARRILAESASGRGYADAILGLEARKVGADRLDVDVSSPSWGTSGLSSILAWPARAV